MAQTKYLNEKLITTFGFEFTYLYKYPYQTAEIEELKVSGYKDLLQADLIIPLKRKDWNIGIDDGAIEINSPVFKKRKDIISFYTLITTTVKEYPLSTHREEISSGGCHIHVGLNRGLGFRNYKQVINNLFRDMYNRPYLNWFFNEYCDDRNAEPFSESIVTNILLRPAHKVTYYDYEFSKLYALRISRITNTLEFRIFDMIKSKEQLLDFVDFVNAYLKYIISITKKRKLIFTAYRSNDNKFIKKDYCIKEFKVLLKDLNLDFKRYKKYIKNYRLRLSAGILKKKRKRVLNIPKSDTTSIEDSNNGGVNSAYPEVTSRGNNSSKGPVLTVNGNWTDTWNSLAQ